MDVHRPEAPCSERVGWRNYRTVGLVGRKWP
jgi:hypothetical protein